MGCSKDETAGCIDKIIPQILPTCDISAQAAESFAKSAHINIHPSFKAEMVNDTPSILSKYSIAVRIIHHYHCIIFLCQFDYPVKGCNIPVHAEYPISNDEPSPCVFCLNKHFFQAFHIQV